MTNPTPRRNRYRGKLRRRLAGLFALGVALMAAGGLYAVAAPAPQTAVAQPDQQALVRQGEQLYNNHCISCHGANLQGVTDRAPSLIGVGEASVFFQVSTGRMPAARQEAQVDKKPVKPFKSQLGEDMSATEAADALAAFVQANGGGPELPQERGEALRGNPADGGELFRANCSSCHNFTGRGGALSSGKFAPNLEKATEEQIYAAMLSGPQNMPKFSDRQLSPEEKKDVIAYVKAVAGQQNNPGGYALGGFGPISEALVTFVVGMAVLIGVTLWIGAKA